MCIKIKAILMRGTDVILYGPASSLACVHEFLECLLSSVSEKLVAH